MEQNTTIDVILENKIKDYKDSANSDNYVVPKELTITITLNEYRELIKGDAIREYEHEKLRIKRYEMESENKKLKEEICRLKDKLISMQDNDSQDNDSEE